MNRSRRIVIFAIVFLIFSGIASIGALRQEKEQLIETKIKEIEKPSFPSFSKTNLPIPTPKEEIEIQSPDNMPLFSIEFLEITKEKSIDISKNLNFKTDLNQFEDYLYGVMYGWTDNNNYLLITPKKSQIRFGMNQFKKQVTNKQLTDEQLKNQALDFLVSKFDMDKNKIEVSSTVYIKQSTDLYVFVESTRNEAQIFHINFTYKEIGHPIFTSSPLYQIIFVEILPNGEIYKAEAYLIKNTTATEEKYKVKTVTDINATIDEAHLISLENDYINIEDVTLRDISNINIQNINIGYYFDDMNINEIIQPIFFLEANVTVRNSKADKAILYLPALQP